jgi:hypothetical protein
MMAAFNSNLSWEWLIFMTNAIQCAFFHFFWKFEEILVINILIHLSHLLNEIVHVNIILIILILNFIISSKLLADIFLYELRYEKPKWKHPAALSLFLSSKNTRIKVTVQMIFFSIFAYPKSSSLREWPLKS